MSDEEIEDALLLTTISKPVGALLLYLMDRDEIDLPELATIALDAPLESPQQES